METADLIRKYVEKKGLSFLTFTRIGPYGMKIVIQDAKGECHVLKAVTDYASSSEMIDAIMLALLQEEVDAFCDRLRDPVSEVLRKIEERLDALEGRLDGLSRRTQSMGRSVIVGGYRCR